MKEKGRKQDWMLVVLVLILTVFGLVVLYSASTWNGQVKFSDSAYYLKKQAFATALGLGAMVFFSRMDYELFERYAVHAYLLSLVLSGLVLVAGSAYNGSRRWLSFGPLSFQPAEFAKAAVIVSASRTISRQKSRHHPGGMGMILKVMGQILPVAALVGTNNLSTAVIILGIGAVLVFVSDPRYLPFAGLGIAGAGFIAVFLGMETYRLERLAVWRDPEQYEKGFQTIQGLYAIGSGGLFGTGLGSSMQKLGFVPEAQNDMIFSIICEELGLAGAVILLLLFFLLIWRFMVIAVHGEDLFGTLAAAGIMTHIALQVILNVAVVTNTIPNTGITLPFVSYGGTSVLFLLSEMGMAVSISTGHRLEHRRI